MSLCSSKAFASKVPKSPEPPVRKIFIFYFYSYF
jgi:hypothetical protein